MSYGISEAERKALDLYIRHIADEMHLRDWTVTLAESPCSDDRMGHHEAVDGVREAVIAINACFATYSPEDQREVIVHELLHAHHATCWRMVQRDLAEPLGRIAYCIFCDSYRRAAEYQIDALAKTIAPHMPLIDWGAGD